MKSHCWYQRTTTLVGPLLPRLPSSEGGTPTHIGSQTYLQHSTGRVSRGTEHAQAGLSCGKVPVL